MPRKEPDKNGALIVNSLFVTMIALAAQEFQHRSCAQIACLTTRLPAAATWVKYVHLAHEHPRQSVNILEILVCHIEGVEQLISHTMRRALIEVLRRDVGRISTSHPRNLILDILRGSCLAGEGPHLLTKPHLQ